ncbi:T-complex protein 11-like protein 1 [Bombina bombina]|uniref:T-complex protein 11-like protein 1 n=1 Tax=Bombina bombina TaxID=8345 RepID=UPI00235AFCD8|nr:T-complex protein 11-like protein 1 [Bombina bombina]XP_053576387.1 T-complex protein 11-like protein 1 [Bombina bombina]XP_053576388.1 T-complex protein 11-like protein 1 [Bombina bombina]XP_053576389.1 T-complex protein 11-like protein 1 [Bombina bombina]
MPLDPSKPHSGEGASGDSNRDGSDTAEESARKKIRQRTPSPHQGNIQLSPSRFVSVEELMEASKGVTNMALAHEIVVAGGLQIKPVELPEGSMEKTVRDIVHKAFWDCLEAQFNEDPPVYDHAIILLGEIKETLISFLLPGHTRLRNQINEVLDLDLIKQQADKGALNIPRLAEFTIGMMATLCAPARDSEVKKLREIKEAVPLFRAIFSVLDLMKLDMANFAVSSLRPHLMQHSVEYERKKFQDITEKLPNSLQVVTEWLQEAANNLLMSKDPVCEEAAAAPRCSDSVLNRAYMQLLKWDHTHRLFPETLLMDQVRFQEMEMELTQLTIVGTLLLITHNSASSALSGLPGFPDRMKSLIRILLEGVGFPSFNMDEALAALGEKICVEVNSTLTQHGFTPFSADRQAALKGQIQAAGSPSNQIRQLIDSRIQSFLLSCLSSSSQKSLPQLPGGLGSIQKELEQIAVRFARLVNYNKLVFSPYYDSILSNILEKKETRPSDTQA